MRWRRVEDDVEGDLAYLQDALLDAAARHVRPGGLLVYSTCSLEPDENEERCASFVDRSNGEFHLEARARAKWRNEWRSHRNPSPRPWRRELRLSIVAPADGDGWRVRGTAEAEERRRVTTLVRVNPNERHGMFTLYCNRSRKVSLCEL
ncbi:RNA cytosine-C(5)-methyltransferase [Pycnococcus provasolii]